KMPKIVSCKNRKEKKILTAYLKTCQYPAVYSKEEKRLLRQKVEYFTLFRDEICFKRRDHLIRAFFGFETALIQQITQIEHSVAHICVNKRIALIIKKYYGILKAYIKEYVKDSEACSRLNSLKTIQPIYINHIFKKFDLFMMDYVDFRRYKFAETVTNTTTIIADDLGSDTKISSEFAKPFKNYREKII
ncbi:hypothetical protein CWI36_2314p0010, partial [Hamiltosporidium magnivora]